MTPIKIESIVIRGENGCVLRVHRDNRGEPYREGISLWVSADGSYENESGLFMEDREIDDLIAGLTAIRKSMKR